MKRFSLGTQLIFGEGALDVLPTLGAKSAMVVTDTFFSQNGLAKQILQQAGFPDGTVFDKVQPDPDAALAAEGAALLQQHRPDLLLALGGGSALDCAKGILLASSHRPVFAAIPTTSGTGSEVTSFSILTHNGIKHALVDPSIRPDYAILDPVLLEHLPAKLIAESGMDAVSHCVEAACATGGSAVTFSLAANALKTLLEQLPLSYSGETASRMPVHLAATMAGMAFDNAGLGAVHALAHALGGAHHVPHGRLCGILLPHVMEANGTQTYGALAAACGFSSSAQLRRSLIALRRQLHLPATLRDAGITAMDAHAIAAAAMEDGCIKTNPLPVEKDTLLRILKEAAG